MLNFVSVLSTTSSNGFHWCHFPTRKLHYYRPQHSCGKVHVFTPVCQSFCSQGEYIPACTGADIPPWADISSIHWGRHIPAYTPLGRHIPTCTGADTPWVDISQHHALWADTPPLTLSKHHVLLGPTPIPPRKPLLLRI